MPFANWWQGLQRKLSRRSTKLQLNHRNLYILPSRFGGLWLLTAGVLYLLGINSRSNGPVLLAFVMTAVLLLSLFLTHLNLQGLSLLALPQHACLAGEATCYRLETHSLCHRPSLKWRWLLVDAPEQQCLHIAPGRHCLDLHWKAPRRGQHLPGRLLLHTTAPLGLFRCWCYWEPPTPIWVAPTPRPGPVQELGQNTSNDGDLFASLRPWRQEEGWRRLDWKAQARGRGQLAKEFVNNSSDELWLAPAPHIPLEIALEHLCDRLLRELRANRPVGLVLADGSRLSPSSDRAHLERCLQALAAWPA